MSRPALAPELFADITAAAPRRLLKKLDKQPQLADGWSWRATAEGWTVAPPGEALVTLVAADGAIRAADDIRCSCLLAPRCLHRLAVAAVLPPAEPPPADATPTEPQAEDEPAAPAAPAAPDEAQRAAAAALWEAGATVLARGARASGALLQGELLRAVHQGRLAGLHRAASAGARVVSGVRALRAADVDGSLPTLTDDLRELLLVSHQLRAAEPRSLAWFGQARRRYQPIGSLRLWGLCCEPVITRGGHAGVVSTLLDREGRLWTIPAVAPADPSLADGPAARVRLSYDQGIGVGGCTLSHRQLARQGLLLQNATASADGRLGSGRAVQAVGASGAGPDEPPLAERWDAPPSASADGRPALLFLQLTVLGAAGPALLLEGRDQTWRALPASEHPALEHVANLQLLARCPGLRLRLVARRPRRGAADVIEPLALLAPGGPDDPAIRLPADWTGRVNLGLDRLSGSHLPTCQPAPLALEPPELTNPLDAVRRRLERMALAGRASLPPAARPTLEREAHQLQRRLMPTAAALLRALPPTPDDAPDAPTLRWLRLACYEDAASP